MNKKHGQHDAVRHILSDVAIIVVVVAVLAILANDFDASERGTIYIVMGLLLVFEAGRYAAVLATATHKFVSVGTVRILVTLAGVILAQSLYAKSFDRDDWQKMFVLAVVFAAWELARRFAAAPRPVTPASPITGPRTKPARKNRRFEKSIERLLARWDTLSDTQRSFMISLARVLIFGVWTVFLVVLGALGHIPMKDALGIK